MRRAAFAQGGADQLRQAKCRELKQHARHAAACAAERARLEGHALDLSRENAAESSLPSPALFAAGCPVCGWSAGLGIRRGRRRMGGGRERRLFTAGGVSSHAEHVEQRKGEAEAGVIGSYDRARFECRRVPTRPLR